ncbi:twin-arginine translocase TatA/TatE family subunit [Kordiimonas lacus]|uniref:Sec-independent protein translocase protein TatA n=1 Tax=Kordiimonas lacus TaxID=637679 RepID=A0A1G6VR47_9PROT|nr:twin-arginine translocase TatA/TatE family subunit [Kordiimonas lacus]SDD55893.1 sec-independent protein translocase protein TatA [Kordiimonas lacus]
MFPGWLQIALVVLLIVLLFGRGKISGLMGDVAKGITSFRKGLKDGIDEPEEEPKAVEDKKTIDGEVVKSEEKDKA